MAAIVMAEEYWANSQFSIARYYGGIKIKSEGKDIEYTIVNKEGKTIYELSVEAEKAGREKAIEPGEPADLVDNRYIPIYRKMGRDRFLKMIENEKIGSPKDAERLIGKYMKIKS